MKIQIPPEVLKELLEAIDEVSTWMQQELAFSLRCDGEEDIGGQEILSKLKAVKHKLEEEAKATAPSSWEPCDCNWLEDPKFEGGTAICGCGERHCRGYRDEVIHWHGKHWRLQCAFEEALTKNP